MSTTTAMIIPSRWSCPVEQGRGDAVVVVGAVEDAVYQAGGEQAVAPSEEDYDQWRRKRHPFVSNRRQIWTDFHSHHFSPRVRRLGLGKGNLLLFRTRHRGLCSQALSRDVSPRLLVVAV